MGKTEKENDAPMKLRDNSTLMSWSRAGLWSEGSTREALCTDMAIWVKEEEGMMFGRRGLGRGVVGT